MHCLILFKDAPGHDHIRAQNMPAHLAFLAKHADMVHAAGPLFDGDTGAGGAWLVDVPDTATAWALVHEDPFWPTGLRADVQVLRWQQVFADGAVA